MGRKGFSLPLIIIPVIAVISAGLFVFLIFFKPNTPAQEQKPTTPSVQKPKTVTNPTPSPLNLAEISSELEVYTNNELGFTLMYPSNFNVVEDFNEEKNTHSISFNMPSPSSYNEGFSVYVQPTKSDDKTFKSEADSYFLPGIGKLGISQFTPNAKLGNLDAVRAENQHDGANYPENLVLIFAIRESDTFTVRVNSTQNNSNVLIESFNNMLNTFTINN